MTSYLPLFPDLLDLIEPIRGNIDIERRGHFVWLAIIYDDERFSFERDRTGKRWIVEIKHHFYEYVTVETGWGSSRKKERKLRYRARIHEKRFTTRDDAIEFAEKVRLVFDRVRSKREVSS